MVGPLAEVDLAILLAFLCGSFVAVWSAVVIGLDIYMAIWEYVQL